MWIHCRVGVSNFAECRENHPVTVRMRNANKSKIPSSWNLLFCNGKGSGKMTRNSEPDHQQELFGSSD